MKKIFIFLSLIIFSSSYYFGQASCSGSGVFTEGSIANYTAASTGNFGNGTTGYVRVCITAATVGTAMCSGTAEHLRIRETDGTLLGTVTSATVLPVCFTSTVNDGLISIQDYCASGTNSYTLTWDTYTTTGATTSACCTPNVLLCSNGAQDCGELGIDCGGICPTPCAGIASCVDAIQNQDETGVDCGGSVCPACGTACTTFSNATMNPAAGSIINASASNQTITTCVTVSYSNASTNWLHGIYVNPTSTGFVSSTGTSSPAAIASMGTTYSWRNQTATFTGNNSGNTITADGWFVDTGDGNPGNNLGWPVGANTSIGPFCFSTVVSCTGLTGDVAATIGFATTADSYSGSWTSNGCGLNTSAGTSAQMSYTLRCPVALPIELLNFEGISTGKENNISWTTSTENNNDYFMLMKSTDGTTWSDFEKINGSGTTISKKSYRTIDKTPGEYITYYKLRQFDIDGEMKESHLIAVISSNYFKDLTLVPNPVEDQAMLIYSSTENTPTKLLIMDISGKLIESIDFETFKGINKQIIFTESLNSGMYYLEIRNDFETKKIRFVK